MVRLAKQSWPQSRPSSWKTTFILDFHLHVHSCARLLKTEALFTHMLDLFYGHSLRHDGWMKHHLEQWGLWKALAASDLLIYASRSYLHNYFPPHYTFSACSPAKRLVKLNRVHVVWVCLSDPLDDTLRPWNLFCGELLHFHRYSDVCKWSSYPTFIVMLSRTPLWWGLFVLASVS